MLLQIDDQHIRIHTSYPPCWGGGEMVDKKRMMLTSLFPPKKIILFPFLVKDSLECMRNGRGYVDLYPEMLVHFFLRFFFSVGGNPLLERH